MATSPADRGIYNVEYFAGTQVSLYIGDVWVDDITTFSFSAQQSRRPLYGYASQLYDDVSEGQFIVQGQFTINFKEAGYLWLILNRYRKLMKQGNDLLNQRGPFEDSGTAERRNIEQVINKELSTIRRNETLLSLANAFGNTDFSRRAAVEQSDLVGTDLANRASLGGFASSTRFSGRAQNGGGGNAGSAEAKFEAFEDAVWGPKNDFDSDKLLHRRTDDARLNPFDIFLNYGDFAGDNDANHSIQRFTDVYILGKSQQIVIDGMPIQEQYSFIARNII